MKRLIIIAVLLISLTGYTMDQNSTNQPQTVMIILHKGHLDKAPRNLRSAPILCECRDGLLILRYLEDIGDMEIMVANMQTGESILTFSSSKDETTHIDLIDEPGDYYLEIRTTHSDWYYAYFSL